jgi:hypothetical protein
VYSVPRKSLLQPLLRLVRPTVILIVVALGVLAVKTYNQWFAANFQYDVVKTAPYMYHGSKVGDGALQEPLPERLPDGRRVMVCYRGHLPSKSQLPSAGNAKIGDMWYNQDDGNYWVLTTLSATNPTLGWIDP